MNFVFRVLACLPIIAAMEAWAEGDSKAGGEKAAVCAACHGVDGNSTVAQWPKLAGQHESYLTRQIILIRDGARAVPEMVAMVAGLSDEDIADLSAYYAGQARSPGAADESLVAVGERIYRAGNSKSGVPACMACHGPAGEGNPFAGYPSLAGQHSVYSVNMLNRFKGGATWGEEDAGSIVMAGVANALKAEEISALASYIQGLHLASD